jgi:hypothetical protein
MSSAIDNHILAEDVIITNYTLSLFTTELKVLRQSSNDCTLVNLILITHTGTITNADEGEDDTVVANHHITLDIHKGEYLTIIADLRSGIYLGLGTYLTCHNSKLLI